MNGTLSTTAWVLHDLGLATSVGGAVFGKAGLHRANGSHSAGHNGQAQITNEAWKEFTPLNLFSHVTVGLTWLVGRTFLTGREVSGATRRLVLAKDVLTGVYVASGLGSTAAGYASAQVREGESTPVTAAVKEIAGRGLTRPQLARRLQRLSSALGSANLASGAALIGLTAVLGMQAGRSTKWSLLSHFLP